jgi:hypothetical protein
MIAPKYSVFSHQMTDKMQYSFLPGEPLVRGAVVEIRQCEVPVGLTISGIMHHSRKKETASCV